MARIWDEKLDVVGYEETWSQGPTVDAGCSLNEDADPADVGSPANWATYCLRAETDSDPNGNAYVAHSFGIGHTRWYTRIEFVVTSLSLGVGEGVYLFWISDTGWGLNIRVSIREVSGTQYIYLSGDGGNSQGPALVLNQKYRVEVKWDHSAGAGNDALWEWKVDGVSKGNGTASDNDCMVIYWGAMGSDAATIVYQDLLAIDDADWVGPEAPPGVAPTGALYGPLRGPLGGPI